MAMRHQEFLDLGGRVFSLSADSPGMNAAVMDKLALPFPILSDETKDNAIRPLGFDDEGDPRQISRPGVVIIDPRGEVVYRFVGRDYADRPDEDVLVDELARLGLDPTEQPEFAPGAPEPGPTAMATEGLTHYFKGAKFATLALRSRHRSLGEEFADDTKEYVKMVERYLEAMEAAKGRKA